MLTSCFGYNAIMRKYLSDIEHYYEYEVVLNNYSFDNDDLSTADRVFFDITFTANNENTLIGHSHSLQVNKSNNEVLVKNGFYDNVKMDDTLVVMSSNWIYMDGNFFYIIEINLDGICYLDRWTGLKNIVDMMNNNKSLL